MYWSDSGELACLASDDSYYILRYRADAVQEATSTNQGIDEDGVEAAFDVSDVNIMCTCSYVYIYMCFCTEAYYIHCIYSL